MARQNKLNLKGNRYGKLTVLEEYINDTKYIKWKCICDCGNTKIVVTGNLRSGHTYHCGCIPKKVWLGRITHGQKIGGATSEYSSWISMKDRCTNINDSSWKHYGGRGIKVCDRWLHSFENFFKDMGKRPSKKHSIDRIDTNGNYEKSNCRWANWYEQAANKRNNTWIEYKGEKKILSEWARLLGIECGNLNTMLKKRSMYHVLEFIERRSKIREYKKLLLNNKWYWEDNINKREMRKTKLGKEITLIKKEIDPKNSIYFRYISKLKFKSLGR